MKNKRKIFSLRDGYVRETETLRSSTASAISSVCNEEKEWTEKREKKAADDDFDEELFKTTGTSRFLLSVKREGKECFVLGSKATNQPTASIDKQVHHLKAPDQVISPFEIPISSGRI